MKGGLPVSASAEFICGAGMPPAFVLSTERRATEAPHPPCGVTMSRKLRRPMVDRLHAVSEPTGGRVASNATLDASVGCADRLPTIVAELDRELRCIYINPMVEMVTGIEPAGYLGKKLEELDRPPELIRQWSQAVMDVFRTGKTVETEFDFPLPAGIRHFGSKMSPQFGRDRRVESVLVISQDMTAHEKQKLALLEEKRFVESLLDLAPCIIAVFDFAEQRCIYCNPMVQTVLGYLPEYLEGLRSQEVLKLIHTDDVSFFTGESQPCLAGLRDGESHMLDLRARDVHGAWRWLRMYTVVYKRDDANNPLQILAAAVDVTNRKQAEQTLARERRMLSRRVEAQTADLRATNHALESALYARDEFMAHMSHELRTPLQAILGLSEVLKSETFGPLNERQAKYAEDIHVNGNRLLNLINDVLTISRLGHGQLMPLLGSVDIERACRQCVDTIRPEAAAKQLAIHWSSTIKGETVCADKEMLAQALMALLSNAVKFTPASGKIGLDLRSAVECNAVCVTVWDTGIGIAEQDLPRLFQPFVQLHVGLTRAYDGAGLGLALVKGLVRLHGGTVGVTSRPGKGSRFKITLPVCNKSVTVAALNSLPATSIRAAPGRDCDFGDIERPPKL